MLLVFVLVIHVRIQRGGQGVWTPLKNHKNIGFSSNIGLDPLKNGSYQASIQCWAIIGPPAKRHLMVFRWRAEDGPLIVVLGSSLPSSTKKKKKKKNIVKVGPPLTKLSGSAHAIIFPYRHTNPTITSAYLHLKSRIALCYGSVIQSLKLPKPKW